MQAKHVPTVAVLTAIAMGETLGAADLRPLRWVLNWHLDRIFPTIPPKVMLAKMRRLKKAGLVQGCPCGCRGDWELTEAGRMVVLEAFQ